MMRITELSEGYRELRQALLVRLSIGAGVLLVLGALGLAWVPGAPHAGDAGRPAAAEAQPRARPVQSPPPIVSAPGPQAVPGAGPAYPSTHAFEKPRLADVMRGISAPEPLEGKTFEVLPRTPTAEGTVETRDDTAAGKSAPAPARLPKGPHLQAGIFAQPANAEEFRRSLEADGYPAYIETRVHVGPFANRREAERAREKLKAQGKSTLFIPQ